MRARTRLWIEAGIMSSLPSSALRSSCSRKRIAGGAFDARQGQALAGVDESFGKELGLPTTAEGRDRSWRRGQSGKSARQAASIGSPSTSRGHHRRACALGHRGSDSRQVPENLRIGSVQILYDYQGWAVAAGAPHHRRRHPACREVRESVVHRVVQRTPFPGLIGKSRNQQGKTTCCSTMVP